jgi:hypothetical protein
MGVMRALKYIWALPTTCVGVPFIFLGTHRNWVEGVLEVHGGWVTKFLRHCTLLQGGAAAMTLGHIVIGVDENALQSTRTHERVHVQQCERWGPFFIPAYLACSGYVMLRGRDGYWDNPFEIEARKMCG